MIPPHTPSGHAGHSPPGLSKGARVCEPPHITVPAEDQSWGLSKGPWAPGGRHRRLCSWGGWEGPGARGARPRGTPDAAFRRRRGGAAGERSTGALLSAEHTEFTWDQKTWEDRLIQVGAGWGRWGQLCGFGVGGVQETLGDTFPSCLKTWGAQAAAAGGPSLEAKAPEAAEGGPSRSPQTRTARGWSGRKGDASRDC